jgi:3-oxoacyl-[acyl-carrier protein] reductase
MATTDLVNPSSLPLQDRVAIVTGSSRGIGKAIAIHLASLGAKLVINYASNKDQADLVAEEINSCCSENTPHATVVQADISVPAQVKLLFDEAERVFGSQVHVLVNSAAISNTKYPTIANTSVEDFDRIFRCLF